MAVYEKVLDRHGKMPVLASREGGRISLSRQLLQPDSLVTEQFRKLRSTLVYHESARGLHSLLITSCLAGEGKTTVSANLSAVMAQGVDSAVILIDADLRRSSLSAALGLRGRAGLADLLVGKGAVKDLLAQTEIENLKILPAGSHPSNPAERIASARMRDLLEHLKEQYEGGYVIIDSTPLVATSEPGVLIELVDGVLLVVRAEKTRRDIVRRELKSIDPEKMLGVVLNGAEFEASQYYRKYYEDYLPG